jgi:hypothetical membrane protein
VPTLRQLCAAGAAVLGGAATGGLLIVAAGTPGFRLQGSVSQLGAVGQPMAGTYRTSVFTIAIAAGLLAVAVVPISLLATVALTGSAAMGSVSASVRCTPGCPLPPAPSATKDDVVHVVASTVAFVLTAWAMLLLARSSTDALARFCRYSVVLVVALGTPVGLALILTGEGIFSGVFERAMMIVVLIWCVGVGAMAARSTPGQLVKEQPAPG